MVSMDVAIAGLALYLSVPLLVAAFLKALPTGFRLFRVTLAASAPRSRSGKASPRFWKRVAACVLIAEAGTGIGLLFGRGYLFTVSIVFACGLYAGFVIVSAKAMRAGRGCGCMGPLSMNRTNLTAVASRAVYAVAATGLLFLQLRNPLVGMHVTSGVWTIVTALLIMTVTAAVVARLVEATFLVGRTANAAELVTEPSGLKAGSTGGMSRDRGPNNSGRLKRPVTRRGLVGSASAAVLGTAAYSLRAPLAVAGASASVGARFRRDHVPADVAELLTIRPDGPIKLEAEHVAAILSVMRQNPLFQNLQAIHDARGGAWRGNQRQALKFPA